MRGIGFIDYRNKLRQPRAYLRHSTCDQALDGGQYDFVPLTICFEDHGVFRNEEPHRYPRSGFDLVAVGAKIAGPLLVFQDVQDAW